MFFKRFFLKLFRGGTPLNRKELIKLGARVGNNFHNYGYIDKGHAYLLTIGDNVTLSNCSIFLHDGSTKKFLGYSKVGRIEIGNNVFVGAGSIVLPNVKIGSNVIIGAGSVISKDIPDNVVCAGNPVRIIDSFDGWLSKNKNQLSVIPRFDKPFEKKSKKNKKEEFQILKDGGYGFDL